VTKTPASQGGDGATHRPLVFIAYRRSDPFIDGRADRTPLIIALIEALDALGYDHFLDVRSIDHGEQWDGKIFRMINRCSVFMPLIGRNWTAELKARRDQGRSDTAMQEVREAIQTEARILPLLIDGGEMPTPDDLPNDMREFSSTETGASISAHATKEDLIARLRPSLAIDARWSVKRRIQRGLRAFTVIAWLICGVAPNAVGLVEYGAAWPGLACAWAGLFIWPIVFLPFAMIALFTPFATMLDSMTEASDPAVWTRQVWPLLAALGMAGLATSSEVFSTEQVPWTVQITPPAATAPHQCPAKPASSPTLSSLISYDRSGSLAAAFDRDGTVPQWLEDKCWPNVFFYLTSQTRMTDSQSLERRQVQHVFQRAMLASQMKHLGIRWSWTSIPYALSFFILIFQGAFGCSMALWLIGQRLLNESDFRERRRANEDIHLGLTFAFVCLMLWVPCRMVTVYTRHLYGCPDLAACPIKLTDYGPDLAMGFIFCMAYSAICIGLLIRYRRAFMVAVSLLYVVVAIAISGFIIDYGAAVSRSTGVWQTYSIASIVAIVLLLPLWSMFSPANVRVNDVRRRLRHRADHLPPV
jgi:hypothetical protein